MSGSRRARRTCLRIVLALAACAPAASAQAAVLLQEITSSRRYFRIRVRKRFRPILAAVTIRMPKKITRVLTSQPWGTIVDLRGLPKGTFAVRITALTRTGKTIKGTRHYRTCRGKLRGGRPPL